MQMHIISRNQLQCEDIKSILSHIWNQTKNQDFFINRTLIFTSFSIVLNINKKRILLLVVDQIPKSKQLNASLTQLVALACHIQLENACKCIHILYHCTIRIDMFHEMLSPIWTLSVYMHCTIRNVPLLIITILLYYYYSFTIFKLLMLN